MERSSGGPREPSDASASSALVPSRRPAPRHRACRSPRPRQAAPEERLMSVSVSLHTHTHMCTRAHTRAHPLLVLFLWRTLNNTHLFLGRQRSPKTREPLLPRRVQRAGQSGRRWSSGPRTATRAPGVPAGHGRRSASCAVEKSAVRVLLLLKAFPAPSGLCASGRLFSRISSLILMSSP